MGESDDAEDVRHPGRKGVTRAKAVMTRQMVVLACIVAAVGACSSKAETPADSVAASAPDIGGAAHVDMIRLDTTSTPPASPPVKSQRDTAPLLRDSASGPKLEIDPHGKVAPIKK